MRFAGLCCGRGWKWPAAGSTILRHLRENSHVTAICAVATPWRGQWHTCMVRPPSVPGRWALVSGGIGAVQTMLITLPPDYRPTDDEEFMNPRQQEYFR